MYVCLYKNSNAFEDLMRNSEGPLSVSVPCSARQGVTFDRGVEGCLAPILKWREWTGRG